MNAYNCIQNETYQEAFRRRKIKQIKIFGIDKMYGVPEKK